MLSTRTGPVRSQALEVYAKNAIVRCPRRYAECPKRFIRQGKEKKSQMSRHQHVHHLPGWGRSIAETHNPHKDTPHAELLGNELLVQPICPLTSATTRSPINASGPALCRCDIDMFEWSECGIVELAGEIAHLGLELPAVDVDATPCIHAVAEEHLRS